MHPASTLTSVILNTWPSIAACDMSWARVLDQSANVFVYHSCFWEVHPDRKTIDLCANVHLEQPRNMARLVQWLDTPDTDASSARQEAKQALRAWLTRPDLCGALGWEMDAEGGGIGIFVSTRRRATYDAILRFAGSSFDITDATIQELRRFFDDVGSEFQVIAVGCFFGRGVDRALRVIVRPTIAVWVDALPPSLQPSVYGLHQALPPDSQANLVLTVHGHDVQVALEARCVHHASAPWHRWVSTLIPSRTPLQDALLDALTEERLRQPTDWPTSVLMDSWTDAQQRLPWLRAHISHVKLRERAAGVLEKKLYGAFDVVWA